MIITEYPYRGDNNKIRTYSDAGKEIMQVETGNLYAEAVDVYPTKYHYTESDTSITGDDVPAEDALGELLEAIG